MKLFEIDDEYMLIWAESSSEAILIAKELGYESATKATMIEDDEIVLIKKEDKETMEFEWTVEGRSPDNVAVRRMTLAKFAKELGLK